MRLIDADAFLERNEELADCDFNHPMYGDTLREIVDAEPTAQHWIPVSEPPEESNCYLITLAGHTWNCEPFRTVAVEYWDNKLQMWYCDEGQTVLAWMPLPPAWKGEEDE